MAVDFHSHILQGIDDGSAGVDMSIAMLRIEAAQGIREVVATPHFYAHSDSPERFAARRAQAYHRLNEAIAPLEGLPQVTLGAEVYYFSGMSDSAALPELSVAGGRCILIEMPHGNWTEAMYMELEGIFRKQGMIPVIAHVDRYIAPLRTRHIPERLAELPVRVQANADFFLNLSTRAMALRLLREDKIQLLGSDCHNLSSRAPNLGAALALIQKRLGQETIARVNGYEMDLLHPE